MISDAQPLNAPITPTLAVDKSANGVSIFVGATPSASSNLTKAAIARQYGVKIGVINNLNVGRTYKQDNIQYPIRK